MNEKLHHLTQYREQLAADYLTAVNYGNYAMAAVYERTLREVDEKLSEVIEKTQAADRVFARYDGTMRRMADNDKKETEEVE